MAEEEKQGADAQAGEAAGDDAVQKKVEKTAGPGLANQKLTNIFLALNAVMMISIAALFLMSRSKDSNKVTHADVEASVNGAKPAGEKDAQGGADKKTAEDSGAHFIKESFIVNLKDSKGAHYAKVDVEIEVEDDLTKNEVRNLSPRIRDFIVVTLSSKTFDQVESVDGRDFLREEIRNKINGYLSRGQIKNIYFTQFIIQ